jgi:hypothetical protein
MIVSLMTITGTRYEQIVMRVFDYPEHFEILELESLHRFNEDASTSHVYNDPHDRYMPSDAPEDGYIYQSEYEEEDDRPSFTRSDDHVNRIIHSIRRAML